MILWNTIPTTYCFCKYNDFLVISNAVSIKRWYSSQTIRLQLVWLQNDKIQIRINLSSSDGRLFPLKVDGIEGMSLSSGIWLFLDKRFKFVPCCCVLGSYLGGRQISLYDRIYLCWAESYQHIFMHFLVVLSINFISA